MKEEFKAFVRTKPELASYVSDGSMTWQKFYELWSLYGKDDKIWETYQKKEVKNNSFTLSSIIDQVKNVDMDSVQKGITNVQKAVELLQGFTTKDAGSSNTSGYVPRQIFKKFED